MNSGPEARQAPRHLAGPGALIVLLIVALISGTGLATESDRGRTLHQVPELAGALELYLQDTGDLPGGGSPEAVNAIPALHDALFLRGPRAPYLEWREDEGADGWGRPLVYRVLGNGPTAARFPGKRYVIYSMGPDGIDQTIDGAAGDDLTCWDPHRLSTEDPITLIFISIALLAPPVLFLVWALRRRPQEAPGRL